MVRVSAQPLEAPLLDHAQQLGLQGEASGPRPGRSRACPPAASSILPALAWRASVKAPVSWPKSSDSEQLLGIDGQWTLMSGPSRRVPS